MSRCIKIIGLAGHIVSPEGPVLQCRNEEDHILRREPHLFIGPNDAIFSVPVTDEEVGVPSSKRRTSHISIKLKVRRVPRGEYIGKWHWFCDSCLFDLTKPLDISFPRYFDSHAEAIANAHVHIKENHS